jgi:catechol 2,3-dioxygenase-like lactoylglutathione lyase family enzyme
VRGSLHHLELWVESLPAAEASWGWLLRELGYVEESRWNHGVSFALGATYVVLEAGPDVARAGHDRRRPGLNHVAFHAGTPGEVDALVAAAPAHGWRLLFAEEHPYAGGPQHYAAYLEDAAGFEVELVAGPAHASP